MKRLTVALLLLLLPVLTAGEARSQKAYVTDSFRISLRRGPSIENKILKFLPSGLSVEVLDAREDWSLVQPLEGDDMEIKGWVLTRYLMIREPWKDQADRTAAELASLKAQLAERESHFQDASRREQELTGKIEKYSRELDRLKEDHEALKKSSADYMKLKAAYETTQKHLADLSRENDLLKASEEKKWFALGALVLLFGLVIGLLIGRRQKTARSLYR